MMRSTGGVLPICSAISNLPKALRERLEAEFSVGLPEIDRRYDSSDGTRRYLLKLADGKTVETVWMPEGSAPPSVFRARSAVRWTASSA